MRQSCTCDYCKVIPPIRACAARGLIVRIGELETAIRDMLAAKSEIECLASLHVFRILISEKRT